LALLGTDGKVSGIRSSPDLLTAPRLVGAGAFYIGNVPACTRRARAFRQNRIRGFDRLEFVPEDVL